MGILIGGAIAAISGPRVALGVAAAGAFAVTVAAMVLLAPDAPVVETRAPAAAGKR